MPEEINQEALREALAKKAEREGRTLTDEQEQPAEVPQEPAPAPEQPPTPEPTAQEAEVTPAPAATLSDLTGGRFSTQEDIDTYVQSQIKEREEAFEAGRYANDRVKHFDELARKGVDINPSLLAEITTNYDAVDISNSREALRLWEKDYKINNPQADQDEVDLRKRKLFGGEDILFGNLPDEEDEDYAEAKQRKTDALIELRAQARKSKEALVERQKNLQLPPEQPKEAPKGITKEEMAKQREVFESNLTQSLSDFNEIKVEVEGETFGYQLTPEEKSAAINEAVTNSQPNANFLVNEFLKEDGTVDYEGLGEMFAFYRNRNKILSKVALEALTKGKEEVLNKTQQKPPTDASGKTTLNGSTQQERLREYLSKNN